MEDDHIVREFFDRIRGMIEHEDELITRRISWFLTFNGFLFTAFGLTFGAAGSAATGVNIVATTDLHRTIEITRTTMAIAGMLTSVISQIGTAAAYIAVASRSVEFKHFLRARFRGQSDPTAALRDLGLPNLLSPHDAIIGGMSPSIMLPLMACGVWFAIGMQAAQTLPTRFAVWGVGATCLVTIVVLILRARSHRIHANAASPVTHETAPAQV